MTDYGVVLFYTTSAALRGEKILKAAGIVVKLIPVPRELSSSCGISLRFLWPDADRIQELLSSAKTDFEGVHQLVGK